MNTPRSSSRPLTTLPPIESKNRPLSRDKTNTVVTHVSPSSIPSLPFITKKIATPTRTDTNDDEDRFKLFKQYEEMLTKTIRNDTRIKQKEIELEEYKKELDMLLQKSTQERNAVERLQKEQADAFKMLENIEEENNRIKARELEQGRKLALLEGTNTDKHEELRNWVDKVTEIKDRVERGPEYIREQIETYVRLTNDWKQENGKLNDEIIMKSNRLNDLKPNMDTRPSNNIRANVYVNPKVVDNGIARTTNERYHGKIPLPVINPKHSFVAYENGHQNKRDKNNQFGENQFPPVNPSDVCKRPSAIPRPIKRKAVLPAINTEKNTRYPVTKSNAFRNNPNTRNATMAGNVLQPKPPTSVPTSTNAFRRRRMRKS